jgi:hypothetical protein
LFSSIIVFEKQEFITREGVKVVVLEMVDAYFPTPFGTRAIVTVTEEMNPLINSQHD